MEPNATEASTAMQWAAGNIFKGSISYSGARDDLALKSTFITLQRANSGF